MQMLCAGALLPLHAVTYNDGGAWLSTNFNEGIPAGYILTNKDGMEIDREAYKDLKYATTWFAEEANGADGKVAMSASHRTGAGTPTDNWLITPLVHVASSEGWLRWKARSLHHDLPDGYEVLVSVADTAHFQSVYKVTAESYSWTTHALPLAAYKGKDIYIAFRHTATNRFLLAIDDVFAGVPEGVDVAPKNTSRHFYGDEATAHITGYIANMGRTLNLKQIAVTTTEGSTYTQPAVQAVATGDTLRYSVDMPIAVGQTYNYTVKAIEADGTEHPLYTDVAVCSRYRRTLFVEKYTGLWCNNCPTALPFLYNLEERFGSEAAIVEVHGYNSRSDVMSNDAYISQLHINAFPTVLFNRDLTNQQMGDWTSFRFLQQSLSTPTDAGLSATAAFTSDGRLQVTTTAVFAADQDNAKDRYRIGYVLKEKLVPGNTIKQDQKNICTTLATEEFNYLPSYIPGTLINYHNVARGGETDEGMDDLGTVRGIKGSLPAMLQAGKEYTHTEVINVPQTVADKNRLQVVALLFKSASVENAAEVSTIDQTQGIFPQVSGTESSFRLSSCGGKCTLFLPRNDAYRVVVSGLDGVVMQTISGTGEIVAIGGLEKGCYLLKVWQSGMEKTFKVAF